MGIKIDIICNDGSPLGVSEAQLYGQDGTGKIGCGGAESALLTLCRAWHNRGDKIRLYNNPSKGDGSVFPQLTLEQFDPKEDRDFLVVFRSPNERVNDARGKRIWLSCDQNTVGDFRAFAQCVDKIVTISRFHSNHFKNIYGINNTIPIDLPVRTWEYRDKQPKDNKRCIFTSMPDRGIMPLQAAWSKIVGAEPDASLVITSDWRLWSQYASVDQILPYKMGFAPLKNVYYHGAISRDALIVEQMRASLFTYPCTYEELFCIACAEAQVAGAFPITSGFGALPEVNMGTVISGNPADPNWINIFVSKVVEMLNDPQLPEKREHIRELALKRFAPENILEQWDRFVFETL